MSGYAAGPTYESIGRTYGATRRADPRIAAQIDAALGRATSVLNVGAGTGNYEPDDRFVVAVEPSPTMIAQRRPHAAPVIQAIAQRLPVATGAFDAVLGTLTLHHWSDLGAGLAEARRVSRRQVFFLYDREVNHRYWLLADYFPQLMAVATEAGAPTPQTLRDHLDVQRVEVVPVPADCTDGFGAAFWCRPEAHLDPVVLAGMSWTAALAPDELADGLDRLRDDLATGAWDDWHGHLRERSELDVGYRLVIAGEVDDAEARPAQVV